MKNILNYRPTNKEFNTGYPKYRKSFVSNKDILNKIILDIGCGCGWFELYAIKKKCKKIFGIDVTEKDLKSARDNISDKRVSFKVDNAINLSFEDNLFDTVVSWDVIEHIPKNSEKLMFGEVGRVLKKMVFSI